MVVTLGQQYNVGEEPTVIRSGERARFVGLFQECTGLWTAGCWLVRRLHQLQASITIDLGISILIISVRV